MREEFNFSHPQITEIPFADMRKRQFFFRLFVLWPDIDYYLFISHLCYSNFTVWIRAKQHENTRK